MHSSHRFQLVCVCLGSSGSRRTIQSTRGSCYSNLRSLVLMLLLTTEREREWIAREILSRDVHWGYSRWHLLSIRGACAKPNKMKNPLAQTQSYLSLAFSASETIQQIMFDWMLSRLCLDDVLGAVVRKSFAFFLSLIWALVCIYFWCWIHEKHYTYTILDIHSMELCIEATCKKWLLSQRLWRISCKNCEQTEQKKWEQATAVDNNNSSVFSVLCICTENKTRAATQTTLYTLRYAAVCATPNVKSNKFLADRFLFRCSNNPTVHCAVDIVSLSSNLLNSQQNQCIQRLQ